MNQQLNLLAVTLGLVLCLQAVNSSIAPKDQCLNGGTQTCVCTCTCPPDRWGSHCQHRVVEGCPSLKEDGKVSSGVYNITVTGVARLVYCDMCLQGSAWMVIQRRINRALSFYYTWSAYRDGFGEVDHEYWLGNKFLHTITYTERYVLRIEMTSSPGITAWAEYDNVKVGPESSNYALESLGRYTGTAGDAFSAYVGQQFVTRELQSSNGCAYHYYSGWWFRGLTTSSSSPNCLNSLLNGQSGSIYWKTWTSSSLRGTLMMIRPHDMSRYQFSRKTAVSSSMALLSDQTFADADAEQADNQGADVPEPKNVEGAAAEVEEPKSGTQLRDVNDFDDFY